MAKTGVIGASLRTEMHSAQATNSRPKPNDAFVELRDFVFDDGETLASLKLHFLTLRNATSRCEWRNRQWGSAASRHRGIGCSTSRRPPSSMRFTAPGSH